MSDFVKTMRNWRRMCNAFGDKHHDECCNFCPLGHLESCGRIWEIEEDTYGTIAETVDAWAAEHPEPVYPTWAEWLIEQRLTEIKGVVFSGHREDETLIAKIEGVLSKAAYEPIPADIAKKLGLKPKGGNGDV